MTKEKVTVKINGAEYTLKGDGSESHLYSIARYVDKMLKDILTGNPMHSNTSAAVLTALTITDELFNLRKELQDLKLESSIPKEREKALIENYEKLEKQYNILKKTYEEYETENKCLKEENLAMKKQLEEIQNKVIFLEEENDKIKRSLQESEEVNKVLINKNNSLKVQAMESLIEITTLKKEREEFREARLKS